MDPQTALKMASASLSATFSSLGEDLAAAL
jgi:hypothetical protein